MGALFGGRQVNQWPPSVAILKTIGQFATYSSLSHAATYATATAKNRIVIASINKSSIPPPYQAPRLFPHHQIMPMVAVS